MEADYEEVAMTSDTSANDVRTEALNFLSNGVYILTATTLDAIHAATVTWASQVSFQPALVIVALRRNSHLAQAVRKAHRFALNIMADDQQESVARFFSHYTAPLEEATGQDKLFRMTMGKCPLLTDGMAWLECKLVAEPASPGDHALMLGEVTGAGVRRQGRPMILYDTPWSYGGIKE
jgi:flavin reductase (DIM6/NTAB) family NADH-FMN oxidoreductase RutF